MEITYEGLDGGTVSFESSSCFEQCLFGASWWPGMELVRSSLVVAANGNMYLQIPIASCVRGTNPLFFSPLTT